MGKIAPRSKSCEVRYGSQALHLTPKEYALLELFRATISAYLAEVRSSIAFGI
jgi:DNA-binding response OmpR family regulator